MPARIVVESGTASPPILPLIEGQSYTVGRSSASSLCVRDRHASREHSVLSFTNGAWIFHDLGPTNGTRIDGRRVEADTPLTDNQVITIGDVRLRFRTESGSDHPFTADPADTNDTTYFEPDELTALLRFTSAALAEQTTQGLIGRALDTLLRQTQADFAGYLDLDPVHVELRLIRPEHASVDVRLSQQLTQAVLRHGRLVWLGSEDGSRVESDSLSRYADAVCVPLRGGPDRPPLGALHLYSRLRLFTERQVRYCEAVGAGLAATLQVLRARLALQADNERLRIHAVGESDRIIGTSPAVVKLRDQVRRLADGPRVVLIIGESGVGKELVALGLHNQSSRHKGPLVTVNCAAIPGGLAESQLFGHTRGSFTDAGADEPGYFAQAETGTLFLDELGEMSMDLQAKLLRAIETRKFRPVGGRTEVMADVRIIAATNRDLEREVREGRFRHDLFWRLPVRITVPPLREHPEDIPEMAAHFLDHLQHEYRRRVELSPAAMERLMNYPWPGNVRQLRSVLEAAVANAGDRATLHAGDLYMVDDAALGGGDGPPGLNLESLEQWAIRQALARTGGNKTKAAGILGIHRETLGLKIKQYRITGQAEQEDNAPGAAGTWSRPG